MASKTFNDFLQVALSQVVSIAVSIVRSLILPVYLGVTGFGYFQSYLFYISLLPIITLGYNDGIYVTYGKYDYKDLPFRKISSGNRIFTFILIIFSLSIILLSVFLISDKILLFVVCLSCLYGIFLGINALTMQILQDTRQFKEYSIYSVLARIASLLLILIVIALKGSVCAIITVDLISFIVITASLLFRHSNLYFSKIDYSLGISELKKSVLKGFPLLIAGLIGILYFGGGRIIVQVLGGIEEFSYYSFAISIASFISVAISSASLVVYPTIARYEQHQKIQAYNTMNKYLKLMIVAIPFVYYISYYLVIYVYKEYTSILSYLGIVFIMMYLQSFISILHNTYYKAMNLEKQLLKDNLLSILSLVILGFLLYYFTNSIISIAIITLAAFVTRYFISIIRLKKTLSKNISINIEELIFAAVFILINTLSIERPLIGLLSMIIISIGYLYLKRQDFMSIKSLIK